MDGMNHFAWVDKLIRGVQIANGVLAKIFAINRIGTIITGADFPFFCARYRSPSNVVRRFDDYVYERDEVKTGSIITH